MKRLLLVSFLCIAPKSIGSYPRANPEKLAPAARHNDFTKVSKLLLRGVNVNYRNKHNQLTCLEYLVYTNGSLLMMDFLISQGADVNSIQPNGATPLIVAVHKNNVAIVKLLLKNGANPNVLREDVSLLETAVLLGNTQPIVRLLIKYGAQIRLPKLRTAVKKSIRRKKQVLL